MNLYELEKFSEDAFRVKKTYVDVAGDLNAGVLLGQIVYWFTPSKDGREKVTIEREGKRWLAKKRRDWWNEVRLSDRQYDRAVQILKKHGLIEVRLFSFGGPPVPHIHLKEDHLTERVKCILRNESNAFNGKRQMHFTENVKSSIQRIHTETTTKTTTPESSASPVSESTHQSKKNDAAVVDAFMKAFGKMPNGLQLEKVSDHLDSGMEPELLIAMFEKAALTGASYSYADAALVRMYQSGIRTFADYEQNEKQRRERGHEATKVDGRSTGGAARKDQAPYRPKQRDYSDVNLEDL